MKYKFLDKDYEELYNLKTRLGFHPQVIKSFRLTVQMIENANDLRTLYMFKSLHIEDLKGNRKGWKSMRLNKQRRLIFKVLEDGNIQIIGIKGIEDYH